MARRLVRSEASRPKKLSTVVRVPESFYSIRVLVISKNNSTGEGLYAGPSRNREHKCGYSQENKQAKWAVGSQISAEEDWERELLDKEEAKVFRGLAARLNFLSLDSELSRGW